MKTFWKSFLEGIASIFNLFPRDLRDDPEIRKILERTDEEALMSDWLTVIEDYNKVIREVDNQDLIS